MTAPALASEESLIISLHRHSRGNYRQKNFDLIRSQQMLPYSQNWELTRDAAIEIAVSLCVRVVSV